MAKTITTNARNEEAISLLHLFTFEMRNHDGTFAEWLRFTDHDVFVQYDGNEYIPMSISFDRLSEDFSLSSDSISIQLDNVNGEVVDKAVTYEWRNNVARIERVIYIPNEQTFGGDDYPVGVVPDVSGGYPEMDLDAVAKKDVYTLFDGAIDTFSATSQSLSGTLTTQFAYWNSPVPKRLFSQNEFTSIIDAMTEELFWGREA
jgi:hypothetical protein